MRFDDFKYVRLEDDKQRKCEINNKQTVCIHRLQITPSIAYT